MSFLLLIRLSLFSYFFFFNDPATTEIYPLPLHAALPIFVRRAEATRNGDVAARVGLHELRFHVLARIACVETARPARLSVRRENVDRRCPRSEEHTSELQSPCNIVCRLLLAKKKKQSMSY